MSATSGLGASTKDKVANKFGIQLKNKNTNKQSELEQTLPSSIEQNTLHTQSSTLLKNKTMSDFRLQNQPNGFQLKASEPVQKTLETSIKSKSSIELLSTPMHNERRDSLTSNVHHSTTLNPVNTNRLNKSNSPSPSSSTTLLSTKPFDTQKRSSLTPIDRSKSPEPSSIKRTSLVTTTTEQSFSSLPAFKRPSISTTSKTEAEIEHQKDQPLYKRQLSKTLDNATALAIKGKHPYELPTQSNSR